MRPDSTPEQRAAGRMPRRDAALVVGLAISSLLGLVWLRGWTSIGAGPELDALADDPAVIALAERGLALELDDHSASLAWRAPGACVERYRFEAVTHVAGAPRIARAWELSITEVDGRPQARMVAADPAAAAVEPERVRELWYAASGVGPAAPDLACRLEILDPIEDVLAFAWPALPAASVGAGTSWTGRAVEGRCHAAACALAPGPGCRAAPWREQLAGASDSVALVRGRWRAGSDPDEGGAAILTSRSLVIADGRPLYALGTVDSKLSEARLELELARLDDCPPPPKPSALAGLRARLRALAGKDRPPHT